MILFIFRRPSVSSNGIMEASLRVLASYEPKIVQICILVCISANKAPSQNLWSIWQKGFLSDFEKMVH